MIYQFEHLNIGQLRKLTEEMLRQYPEFETPEKLLKHLEQCRDTVFGEEDNV